MDPSPKPKRPTPNALLARPLLLAGLFFACGMLLLALLAPALAPHDPLRPLAHGLGSYGEPAAPGPEIPLGAKGSRGRGCGRGEARPRASCSATCCPPCCPPCSSWRA